MNKKAVELTINTLIIFAIALLTGVIIMFIVGSGIRDGGGFFRTGFEDTNMRAECSGAFITDLDNDGLDDCKTYGEDNKRCDTSVPPGSCPS